MNKTHLTHIEFDTLVAQLGPVIKEAMVDAIVCIRKESAILVTQAKTAYDPNKTDIVTNADCAAQDLYLGRFVKAFPGIGLVGEEDGLKQPCTLVVDGVEIDLYITIDPLDGTKAFARHMSYGVGTMIGVVRDGKVIAAYVGDVNTGEIYGFAPNAPAPTRTRFDVETTLAPDTTTRLGDRYMMLNNAPCRFPSNIQAMTMKPREGGLFRDIDVMGGSYGVFMARLWKGEVAMVILDPAHCTPWDEIPVLGITEQLGFVFIRVDQDETFQVFKPEIPTTVRAIPFNTIVVHKDYGSTVLAHLGRP